MNKMVPSVLKVVCFTFFDGEYAHVDQQINAVEYEYAEDIIIHLCKTRLSIGPVARHLFALYCPSQKVWLEPCEQVRFFDCKKFQELEMLIRFKPTDPKNLARIDKQAFDYYFCQIREIFLNSSISEMDDRLLGIIIMNVLVHIIEKNLPIEKPLEYLKLPDFFPSHPFMKKFAKSYQKQEKKSIEFVRFLSDGYYRALSNDENLIPADFVKAEFITSLLSHEEYEAPVIEKLGQEIFPVKVLSEKGDYKANLRFRTQYLDLSLYSGKIWERICFLQDLDGISFMGYGVELEQKNGTTIRFTCDLYIGKSLCALLEGYYRLTVSSERFITKYFTPPSIKMMRENNCHGPISYESAVEKLNTEGSGWGTYLIRMNEKEYVYNIHVLVRGGVETLIVEPIVENMEDLRTERKFFIKGYKKLFVDLQFLCNDLEITTCDGEVSLRDCIKPKDCDVIADHPLFKNSNKQIQNGSTKEDIINHTTDLLPQSKNSNRIGCDGSFSSYKIPYKGELKIRKVLDKTTVTERFEFLLKAEKWKNFRTELLVHVIDFTIENSSIIIDYFPHGTLDLYLQKNRETLSIFNLLECATYLAKAVKYLHDRRITHGSIRCRTLYVIEHPPQPFRLKLGDPFININHNEDRLWIAPEYHSCSDIVPTSIDIWATATTLWEIFSYGSKPPGREVHYLNCPLSCPYDFWTTIQKCWSPKPEERVSPAYIHQQIQDLIIQEYQVENPTPRNSQNFGREAGWGTRLRLPKFLRPKSDRFSGLFSLRGSDSNMENSESDSDEETWIIPSSRLSISIVNNCEEILGKGNYGEVIKARYPEWSDSYVAVKRINNRYKQKPGVLGDMIREFEIMTELHHENIISVVGIVKEPEIMLVMEFMPMGSLVKYLRNFEKEKQDPGRIKSVKYALDIANGMQYLESRKILHRDLAARNILMAREDLVKLADFGLAQSLGPNEETYLVKTPRYLPFRWYAPESIKAPPEFSHKSDVWSFGVTLWEILSLGEMPKFSTIDNNSPQQLLNHILSGERLPYPDKKVANADRLWPIISGCWIIEQDFRPSFSDLKGMIQAHFNEV